MSLRTVIVQSRTHIQPLISMDHFTVVYLVAWPLYAYEAGVELVLIETSLPFLCKLLLISMRTASSA